LHLISVISGDTSLEPVIASGDGKDLEDFDALAKDIKIPEVDNEVRSAVQLDVLWAEFLATGKYAPIRRIVDALALIKYTGTLERIKSGEIKKVTEAIEMQANYEAIHRAAVWSLHSNCKQMPLVHKYCVFMYANEDLAASVKRQLGAILRRVQKG
jgi:hypothetical protein